MIFSPPENYACPKGSLVELNILAFMTEEMQILKALACSVRYRILTQILIEPDYTTSLSKKLNIESSLVTHSLKRLEKVGLLLTYRNGKLKYYEIADKRAMRNLFSSLERLSRKNREALH